MQQYYSEVFSLSQIQAENDYLGLQHQQKNLEGN